MTNIKLSPASYKEDPVSELDVLFIGSGVAAMSGANYLASEGLRTLVVDMHNKIGGNLATTPRVDNVFGCFAESGRDIANELQRQYMYFNHHKPGVANILLNSRVSSVTLNGQVYVQDAFNVQPMISITPRIIVVASGLSWEAGNFAEEINIRPHDLYYGPDMCQVEPEHSSNRYIVVGGGNSAAQAALSFAHRGVPCAMLVRSGLKTSSYLEKELHEQSKLIQICPLEGAWCEKSHGAYDLRIDGRRIGFFDKVIYAGSAVPNSDFLYQDMLDENGYVRTNSIYQVAGNIYAIGDVRSGNPRRAAVAIGDGARIASIVHEKLQTGTHPRSTNG